MLRIISSTARDAAEDSCREVSRADGEGNVAWLERQLRAADSSLLQPATAEAAEGGTAQGPPTLVLLLGGRTPTAFRLRVAQSHTRHDLTPSHWSHAALLGPLPDALADVTLYEISLEPTTGFGFPPEDNALQKGRLDPYDDPERYPNVALLRIPVPIDEWHEPTDGAVTLLRHFRMQRTVLDATELVLEWLAFLWGVGRTGNPLLAGQGIPSAAMIEMVLNAARFDVTPGLESRASCPEAIWQAARWWHEYYEKLDEERISGVFTVDHRLDRY